MEVHQGKVQDVADENARARSPPWIPSQSQRPPAQAVELHRRSAANQQQQKDALDLLLLGSTSHAHVAAEKTQQQPASVGLQSTQGRKLSKELRYQTWF